MPSGSISNPLYFFSSSLNNSPTDGTVRLTDVMDFFFIAHPLSGRKEGEEEKRIMYFYPKFESIDRQTEVTGFAEAIANFTNNFVDPKKKNADKPEFPFRTVSTKKTNQMYIQVENEEFLVGISLLKSQCESMELFVFPPAIIEVLTNCYKMFKLFFGEFAPFRNKNEEKFKERLDYFFSRFLPQQRLHKVQLLDCLEGAAFLPLPGPKYLSIVTLSLEIKEEFPAIEKILILYQNKVLYYTVSSNDLPSIFQYLTESLLPSSMVPELDPSRHATNGRFLRGPSDLNSDEPLDGDDVLPTVHLHTPAEDEEELLLPYQMMVYRCMNATICMFVKSTVTRKLMRNLDGFLSTELTTLASQISESLDNQEKSLSPDDFHYIYYNPSSLSLTSSFGNGSGPQPSFPPFDVNRLLCETMSKYVPANDAFAEVFVKSDSDWWIMIKRMNARLLCIILPPGTSQQSLADVQSRTDHIIKTHFDAIFFH